jgi:hypothetical protein
MRSDLTTIFWTFNALIARVLRAWWFAPVILLGGCVGSMRIESELFKRTDFSEAKPWYLEVAHKTQSGGQVNLKRVNDARDAAALGGSFWLEPGDGKLQQLYASYKVLSVSPDGNSQDIEIFVGGDTAYVWNRYRVTNNTLRPISKRTFGMLSGFVALPLTLFSFWGIRRFASRLAFRSMNVLRLRTTT